MSELGFPILSAPSASDLADLKAPNRAIADRDTKTIEKTAKDFESVLLQRLTEGMRQTIPDSGLLDSESNDQIQSIFWMGLSQELGKQGGLGLWKQLAKQMRVTAAGTAPSETQEPTP